MRADQRPLWTEAPHAAWDAYDPAIDGAWDLSRAAHLHRRAGFGATPAQLARDQAEGHEVSVRRVLEGEASGPDGRSRSEFDEVYAAMADSSRSDPTMSRVRLGWLFRFLHSPQPLQERMTLAWHGHYATGSQKVDDPLAMLDQLESIRRVWDSPISKLHRAMLDATAMQVWLDGFQSERDRPNENLGREFLELFALGDGNYGEPDVKAAARALTGYRPAKRDDFQFAPAVFSARHHDDGVKTLLGESGAWGPSDVVRIALKQSAAAKHIARRLYVTFIDDLEPPQVELVASLADRIRKPEDVDVRRGIELVLRSRLFHAEGVRARKVKSPVDFVVGLVRTTGWYRSTPDPNALELHLTRMGQTLLDPPSVAGWPGGLAWLAAPLVIARANFVADITGRPGIGAHLRNLAAAARLHTPTAWGSAVAHAFLGMASAREIAGFPAQSNHVEALRLITSLPEAHLA